MSYQPVVMDKEGTNKPYLQEARDISVVYFSTGLAILIIATLLGFLNRLAQTGAISYGSPFKEGPQIWYTLMTLHGMAAFVGWGAFVCIGMTFYVLTHALDAPLHDTKLPKIAYFFFVAGFLLIIYATLFGNFGGSWVFLFPIAFFGYWESWAITVWTAGVLLAGVGIILVNLEVILTIRKAGYSFIAALGFEAFKPKPKNGYKVPTPIVPLAVNAIGMIIATIPFAVLLLLFIFKSTFMPDLAIDELVAKNTLWWFGHPIVYALLFPVAGMGYYMAMRITKSNVVGEQITKITWAIAFLIQNIIGSHHMYQDIVQPVPIQIAQQLLTYVITLPSVSSIFVIAGTLWAREFEWGLAPKYLYLAALGWLLAGMSGVVNATILINTFIHNTLWIVAHFHTMALLNITMMLFGTAYFLITDTSGNEIYSERLGTWSMWLKYIGTIGFVHMWFMQGILGGLRRVATSSPGTGLLTWLSIPFGLAILVGIWLSSYNLWKTYSGANFVAPVVDPVNAD